MRTDDVEDEELGYQWEDPGLNGEEGVGNAFVVAGFFETKVEELGADSLEEGFEVKERVLALPVVDVSDEIGVLGGLEGGEAGEGDVGEGGERGEVGGAADGFEFDSFGSGEEKRDVAQ